LKRNITANNLVEMPFGHGFVDALTSSSVA
jgi:hypothetical protein